MKELSIEEKFKEAKRLYETANADQRYVLESLFPELAEPEDERIIKAIKSAVLQLTDIYLQEKYGLKQSDCIAWLEKHSSSQTKE